MQVVSLVTQVLIALCMLMALPVLLLFVNLCHHSCLSMYVWHSEFSHEPAVTLSLSITNELNKNADMFMLYLYESKHFINLLF